MPCKNGFDCLADIRKADTLFSDLKVIMLSTSSSPENIQLSYELGADFSAVKPNAFQGFKDLLQDIITLDRNSFKNRQNFLLTEKLI